MARKTPDLGEIACADCGATVTRRSPSQRYCPPCSGVRDTARKIAWRGRNPASPPAPDRYERLQSQMVVKGAEASLESRAQMSWLAAVEVDADAHQAIRVAVPFSYAISKNAVWSHGKGGHVYARRGSNIQRDRLIHAIRQASPDVRWYQGKVWIDIFVEKPDQRGDAINVVDIVCDAVKVAIGVDDRWFCITRLDWSIVKQDPRILVGVRQVVTEDHQACSHCGRLLPLATSFGSNKSTKTGFARVCRECAAPVRGPRSAAA